MRISDWSSDVCSSDLAALIFFRLQLAILSPVAQILHLARNSSNALARRVLDYGSNKPAGDGHGHRDIDAGEFKHLVACELHIAFRHLHERYGQRLDKPGINGQFDATARTPDIKCYQPIQQFDELNRLN